MTRITLPNPAFAAEHCAGHCICCHRFRRRRRLRSGIGIMALVGMVFAGYVAYQRNLIYLENVSATITWFADRLRSEVETHKRLDALSTQLKSAEKRSAQLQRSLEKLAKSCGRSSPSTSGIPWPFSSGQ
jgi:hypothetical protein